jgi:hypothetical protein
MEKRIFNFSKGLGIFFAVAAGIGTAVLGYVDRTDWIQVAFYSVAVTALVYGVGIISPLSGPISYLKKKISQSKLMQLKNLLKEVYFGN